MSAKRMMAVPDRGDCGVRGGRGRRAHCLGRRQRRRRACILDAIGTLEMSGGHPDAPRRASGCRATTIGRATVDARTHSALKHERRRPSRAGTVTVNAPERCDGMPPVTSWLVDAASRAQATPHSRGSSLASRARCMRQRRVKHPPVAHAHVAKDSSPCERTATADTGVAVRKRHEHEQMRHALRIPRRVVDARRRAMTQRRTGRTARRPSTLATASRSATCASSEKSAHVTVRDPHAAHVEAMTRKPSLRASASIAARILGSCHSHVQMAPACSSETIRAVSPHPWRKRRCSCRRRCRHVVDLRFHHAPAPSARRTPAAAPRCP